jgi:AraC-like DNA-binding protein
MGRVSIRTEVRWEQSVLGAPVVAADPTLQALFEARLREAAASVAAEAEPEVLTRAREVILANLEMGEVTLDLVARRLATGRRSLQRRLSDAGTTFQELLDECRRGLVLSLARGR